MESSYVCNEKVEKVQDCHAEHSSCHAERSEESHSLGLSDASIS